VKTLARLLPLLIFVALILAFRLSGCKFEPLPAEETTHSSSATSSVTDQTTHQTETSLETTNRPSGGTDQTTSETTSETSGTAETTDVTTADPGTLSNEKLSWYYTVPSPLGENRPASIPASVRNLAGPYDVIWQHPQEGRKVVYLTMDEGYEFETNTTEILDTAKLKGVPITFFITGGYLRDHPELVGRMVDEGHLVANHTVSHPNLPALLDEKGRDALLAELDDLAADFKNTIGIDLPKLVRPPEGAYSESVLAILRQAGYRAVFWSFAYRDWLTAEQPDPAAAMDKILGQLHDGSILLLHAVSNTNVAILPDLIDEIRTRGYEFALVDEIP
jgi:peptidoglycan-N-acetylmuramic acid deacetylase